MRRFGFQVLWLPLLCPIPCLPRPLSGRKIAEIVSHPFLPGHQCGDVERPWTYGAYLEAGLETCPNCRHDICHMHHMQRMCKIISPWVKLYIFKVFLTVYKGIILVLGNIQSCKPMIKY